MTYIVWMPHVQWFHRAKLFSRQLLGQFAHAVFRDHGVPVGQLTVAVAGVHLVPRGVKRKHRTAERTAMRNIGL